MAHDALGAHAREELGIVEMHRARPIQAAFTSAATFSVGAFLPLITAVVAPHGVTLPVVGGASLRVARRPRRARRSHRRRARWQRPSSA